MGISHRPLLAVALFAALALSYLWCIVDFIVQNPTYSGDNTSVSIVVVLVGTLWLIGHGVHGAAVFALPAMVLRRTGTHEDELGKFYDDN